MDKNKIEVKYGSFKSERRIIHFWIKVQDENKAIVAGAIKYPHNIYLTDCTIHRFCDEHDGDECAHSPTGFCRTYDELRYSSLDINFSEYLIWQIIMERINNVRKTFPYLEYKDILNQILSLEIWEG